MKSVRSFGFIWFLIFPLLASADNLTGLDVSISSSGDVPEVSISCVIGSNYTLSLVSSFPYNFGVVERKYCSSGVITFSTFNLNTKLLQETGDSQWWRWIRTPLQYIIKNTTSDYLTACSESSCPKNNLAGAFNSYDQNVYQAADTFWPTTAAGPAFSTDDYSTWFNSANGDGRLNYSAPPTYSSVLFLPGLKASRLYKNGIINCSVNCEDQLWEPNWDTDVEALFMNPDGTSADEMVYTRDVMEEAFGAINIYKSFLGNLEEMKTVDGTIADYSAVPYDWRLSLEDIINGGTKTGENISYIGESDEPYIMSELARLASTSDNGRVTIVAHSNGGLVAKALLKKLADENNPLLTKVDKLILVAVPQLGTPSAITAMLHGDKQGIPVVATERTARRLGEYLPGGYHLLPSEKYFETVSSPVVTFGDGVDDWESRFGNDVTSESGLHNFVTDSYERVESEDENLLTPSYLHSDLLSDAESVHESLDSWTPPATIEVIAIAGWGIPTTISSVKYYEDKGKVKFEPVFTVDGDGTVVTPSAHWSNGVTASTTKYWFNLDEYNDNNYDLKHKDILEASSMWLLIKNSILEKSINPLLYLSTSVPSNNQINRLIYSLHSPLTLSIYDSFGNHTGVSTTTGEIEEQIPGTYFIQFGDEKYIFTDSGSPFTISMSGYDSGTFTFKIQQLQGDNTVSMVEFKDLPATPNTRVTMSITDDIQTLSHLSIDSDSDGNSDINLTPVMGGVVTYTPPAPVIEPSPVSVGGNGPIVMKNITQVATSTMEVIIASSTTSIPVEIATTTVSTTSLISVTNLKQKPKPAIQKQKIVVQNQTKEADAESNLKQTAQVIFSEANNPPRFSGFLRRFSSWISGVFK